MKEIKLINSDKVTIVDDEDFDRLNIFKWSLTFKGYVARKVNRKDEFLHRQVLKTNLLVDHINHDKLDNRRCNLRPATNSQNLMNSKKYSGGTSKYKGVYYNPKNNTWRASIRKNGILKGLGQYEKEEDAALVYNQFAKELFGEFANLNIIPISN